MFVDRDQIGLAVNKVGFVIINNPFAADFFEVRSAEKSQFVCVDIRITHEELLTIVVFLFLAFAQPAGSVLSG